MRTDGDDLDELMNTAQQLLDSAASDLAINGAGERTAADDTRQILEEQQRPLLRADDEQTEHDIDESSANAEGQRLQKLAYQIAKHNHDREGVVHHGVTCDECGSHPIKGPRYHCNNCPDFDLCETCEAKDSHLRTHVFTKIKVPAPWGGKDPQPVWYPGKPHKMPPTLDCFKFRPERALLATKTDFKVYQIDALYLQFTCIANTECEDISGIGYAIDLATFNQCFVQQILITKASMPSLIKTRLFRLFDADENGFIDFHEFVIGMALVHGQKPELRRQRIFKGLDLDDDGFICRKDCQLMFKSFYTLNREILLGYLEVDRYAENALVLQNDHDPKDHIAGGRSLANYFNGGFPYMSRTPLWLGSRREQKTVGAHGDLVPDGFKVSVVRDDDQDEDTRTPDTVAKGTHLKLHWVYHDELTRLCTGKSMHYLSNDQIRAFDIPTEMTGQGFKWHRGRLWIADAESNNDKQAFILVEDEDLQPEPAWRSKLDDVHFAAELRRTIQTRLIHIELWDAVLSKGDEKILLREQRDALGLEDCPYVPIGVQEKCASGYRNEKNAENYVGGTAAAHTIFLVARDALDELLSHIFEEGETLAHEIQETAAKRIAHAAAIQGHLERLFSRRWEQNKHLLGSTPSDTLPSNKDSPLSRRTVTEQYKDVVRKGRGRGAAMVRYACFFQHVGCSKEYGHTDDCGWKLLLWALEIEARVRLQDRIGTTWRERRDRRTSFVTAIQGTTMTSDDGSDVGDDPTMPQFRPDTVSPATDTAITRPKPSMPTALVDNGVANDTSLGSAVLQSSLSPEEDSDDKVGGDSEPKEVQELSKEQLEYLTLVEAAARRHQHKGGSGAGYIDLQEFEESLEKQDDKGRQLLAWMGGWVDLVNF